MIIIVYLVVTNKKISSKIKALHTSVFELDDKLRFLQQKFISLEKSLEDKTKVSSKNEAPQTEQQNISILEEKPIIAIEKPKEPIVFESPIVEKTIVSNSPETSSILDQEKPIFKNVKSEKELTAKKSWITNFKEKNPDLEKFIGENLINKVGVLILVLGISFFVKYAIDKDWINEPARVGIGVLCGTLIMIIAHKLKKKYTSFSSVLVAGAISVFYFTIYTAFHEYQLFSQTVAFSILAIITVFSTLVSVSYNRQELAVLSLIGGFAAPFMVSAGDGNYVVLFTYIAILNLGILAVSYFKKWKVATILDFCFTIVLFITWCLTSINNKDFEHSGALTFAAIFYVIFSITIVLYNLKNKGVFSITEYFILLANTFIFFGIGIFILKDIDSNYTGLFTLLLALYNIGYASLLFKKFNLDKNAVYVLIGLALTFVTLTIPIQFNGNQITNFWAVEVVLLFWLAQKSKIEAFKVSALIVQILSLISLYLDWETYTYSEELSVILNPVFISGFLVSISLFFVHMLMKKETNIAIKFFTININIYQSILLIVFVFVVYLTGFLEILYQANQFLQNKASATSFTVTYHFLFVFLLLFCNNKLKIKFLKKAVLIITVFSIFLYITIFYKLPKVEIVRNFQMSLDSNYAFYLHYIILGCLIYFGYQLFTKTSTIFNVKTALSKWLPWLFVFAIIYVLSNEIMIHGLRFSEEITNLTQLKEEKGVLTNYMIITNKISSVQAQIIKIGYPILWGVFAFIFLIIGIKKQWKNLRIIALSLLGITIVKLFVYDIKNASETGKIIAFILLGVLILIISFVYQKIKKLVVNEPSKNESKGEKI